MRVPALALCLVTAAGAVAQPPAANPYAQEVRAALADARKLDPVAAALTRYLSLAQVPEKDRDELRTALDFWANSLSREAVLVKARRVSDTLVALNVLAYGWDPAVYEKLADEDPWYHVQVDLVVGKPGRMYFGRDGSSKAGWYDVKVTADKRVAALAPWLPAADAAELVARTQTAAPLLRADWFLSRVAIQFGRKGTGYYDWLGIKDRRDAERLAGLDRKKAQDVKREVAAIVARSGVANLPRQIFRLGALTGGWWETRDRVTDNRDAGNAVRNLDGDYKHEAEETYFALPNRLFGYGAFAADGTRQDSAPDGIGFDRTAPANDGKIHNALSCVRCHVEGLRPINDWGRRAYAPPNALTAADPAKYQRLVQLYLGELAEWYDEDNAAYARTLLRLTRMKPDELAKAVGRVWAAYVERDYGPADVAADVGLTERAYLDRLVAYRKANQLSDPVLASHLANPALPIRTDDYEQLAPLLYPILLPTPKPEK